MEIRKCFKVNDNISSILLCCTSDVQGFRLLFFFLPRPLLRAFLVIG